MGATILLADDSITIQKVIELTFAETEHRVVAVGSGRDLLDRVGTLKPDAVLCDVVMPDMNGYDICQTLKSDPATLHIPVVLLTGTFEPFDRTRALAAGCDAIVTKPFEAEELIRTVEELLRRKPQSSTTVPVGLEAVGVPEGVPALDFTTTGFERMGVKESFQEPQIPEEGLEFSSTGVVAPPPPVSAGGEDIFTKEVGLTSHRGAGEELPTAEEIEAAVVEDETFPSAPRPPAQVEAVGAMARRVEAGTEALWSPADHRWPADEGVVDEGAAAERAAVEAMPVEEEEETVIAPPDIVTPVPAPAAPAPTPAEPATGFVQTTPPPPPTLASPVVGSAGAAMALSDEEIERIAHKVLEQATPLLERIAWEVIPDMAEMLVRKRIRELEAAAELES